MLRVLRFPLKYMFLGASYRVKVHIRLMVFLKDKKMNRLAEFLANRLQKVQGVFISPKAQFDSTLILKHPVGIVIGEGVKLGCNVTLYQNVTLGGARLGDAKRGNYPEVGDNTVIFSGAVVIGKVTIGDNCTIGANSVVMSSIPKDSVAVGAPARFIKKN